MSTSHPATTPTEDLISGTTNLTPTTPPPPKDAPKGGSPSNVVLRLVPSDDSPED